MTGALVLAGRPNTGVFADVSDAPVEAVIDIAGQPMINYVLAALKDCPGIDRIVVVGDEAAIRPVLSDGEVEFCEPGGSLVANLRTGFAALAGLRRIMVVTDDAVLMTGPVLHDFQQRCLALAGDAKFFYAIVAKHSYERQFPDSRRTYVRLRDGVYTGGNVFMVDGNIAQSLLGFVEQLYARRKQPVALARLLGFGIILRYALGRLTVDQLERHVAGMVGAAGRAVIGPPELGFDVDRPEDLPVAARYLARRDQGG